MVKQWKKDQASRCYTADVCLCQSVNQLLNNQKMAKHVLLFHCLYIGHLFNGMLKDFNEIYVWMNNRIILRKE